MNSCHEEGVSDRNRAGIEAADPALDSGREHPPRDIRNWTLLCEIDASSSTSLGGWWGSGTTPEGSASIARQEASSL
eukprot:gene16108-biopygen483